MKKYFPLFLLIFTSISISAQSKQYLHNTQVDQNGNQKRYFTAKKITLAEEQAFGKSVAQRVGNLNREGNPHYMASVVNYNEVKNYLENISGQKYDNKIFLISYTFVDDACSSNNNNWDKTFTNRRKKMNAPQKKEIEKRNTQLVILKIVENGISLSNSIDSPKEYIFADKDNFLRNSIFTIPSFCGSTALVKSNGETLVMNGETGIWYAEQHLKPDNWKHFFPAQK